MKCKRVIVLGFLVIFTSVLFFSPLNTYNIDQPENVKVEIESVSRNLFNQTMPDCDVSRAVHPAESELSDSKRETLSNLSIIFFALNSLAALSADSKSSRWAAGIMKFYCPSFCHLPPETLCSSWSMIPRLENRLP